ncbi:DUF6124 family protein [Pseudomonas sp. ABY48]|uniref:DUF6124 family protein n=1 Tax=Pseudomonas sp. ABY48 TaxID=3402865 RepID=UPI003B4329C2
MHLSYLTVLTDGRLERQPKTSWPRLTGAPPRNLALAIHQMGEMGVLLLEKLLDNEAKVQR